MRTLLIAICLSVLPATAAELYTFTPLAPETVSRPGGVGSVTGWGYSIQNQSSSDWLVTTDLTAGAFFHATPQLLFDFPDVAPGATATVLYDPGPPANGLYQLVWDANAPAGFVNSGSFTLEASMVEWRPPRWRRVPGHRSYRKRALQHSDNAGTGGHGNARTIGLVVRRRQSFPAPERRLSV
jgi:hypothetical protein